MGNLSGLMVVSMPGLGSSESDVVLEELEVHLSVKWVVGR